MTKEELRANVERILKTSATQETLNIFYCKPQNQDKVLKAREVSDEEIDRVTEEIWNKIYNK